jgi:[ribosomal protein S18]-alanine N-acetyltransferase
MRFTEMSQSEAREIAAWKYEPPYDFYDAAKDPEDFDEHLDPEKRRDYFSAISGGELVGYFCFGSKARVLGGDYSGDALDIGLGMRPDLTGRGLGLDFLEAGLAFAKRRFSHAAFRLSVAEFNERAITVYERAGFAKTGAFTRRANGGDHTFILMARPA